jgi:hypothetical protein
MPGKHAGKCLKEMVDFCSTPYVAFIGDDDFFIPSGLVRCIEFLEKHPDYAAAHGESLSVTLDQSGAYGNPIAAVHYPQPVLEHTDPTQRIAQLMSGYGVTLFSVHRIETWRSMFQDTDKVTDKAFREELLPCLMTVILGKVAALNDLYLVRQHHDQRYALPTTFEWVGKPDWSASYHKTCESLARELGMRTNLPFNDALQVLQQCFSIYISLALARESLKVAINTPFDPKVKPWDIQALLNPQGEFYQQFLPVGQAMKGH